METVLGHPAAKPLTPVSSGERIQALDVVRGFALIGILMMNVEYFNRALSDLGTGIQSGLTGANWWVGWFVQYFVIGKFWTTFSLLFGMGFAVMLTRAERAQRDFLVPYMRRIAALAVFGALHFIVLWGGDILFSYAVGATALLIVLHGRPLYILLGIAIAIGVGFIPGCDWSFGVAGGLTFFGVAAWWMRGDKEVRIFGKPMLPIVLLMIVIGTLALLAGIGFWIFRPPMVPPPARYFTPVLGVALLVSGSRTARFHDPRESRSWRLGAGIYTFAFFMMTTVGALLYIVPPSLATPAAVQAAIAQAPASASASAGASAASGPAAKKGPPTEAERAAEQAAERAKSLKEHAEEIRTETRVTSTGTYADVVKLRASKFPEHAVHQVGFAVIIIGMFLLGTWFVRSGVMENTAAHLPLFRKLAMFGIPFGVGLGLLGSAITMTHIPGDMSDGYQFAQGLLMLGNLPACLGYVSLIVLMLHSKTVFANVRVLAPFGRMALTNYLTQSLIATTYFYGYGFGHWGASRVSQMLFVATIVVLQVAFSRFWLARFRYGPMEWLWRAITYWQIPPMRIEQAAIVAAVPNAG
jgi:uncharacterized protein